MYKFNVIQGEVIKCKINITREEGDTTVAERSVESTRGEGTEGGERDNEAESGQSATGARNVTQCRNVSPRTL